MLSPIEQKLGLILDHALEFFPSKSVLYLQDFSYLMDIWMIHLPKDCVQNTINDWIRNWHNIGDWILGGGLVNSHLSKHFKALLRRVSIVSHVRFKVEEFKAIFSTIVLVILQPIFVAIFLPGSSWGLIDKTQLALFCFACWNQGKTIKSCYFCTILLAWLEQQRTNDANSYSGWDNSEDH